MTNFASHLLLIVARITILVLLFILVDVLLLPAGAEPFVPWYKLFGALP